jgi:hypothetical protein
MLMDEQQIYEIEDGVRRAKAAWLSGHEQIAARIRSGLVFAVPIRNLRSPHKVSIDISGIGGLRWDRVLRATKAGIPLPPIDILPGTRGKSIEEVSVPDNELDLFR